MDSSSEKKISPQEKRAMTMAKKRARGRYLSARGRAAKAAEKFNQDVAKAGLEHYGPRTGGS